MTHNPPDVTLVPCTREHLTQLLGWIDSAALNLQRAGPTFDDPLTLEQLTRHLAQPAVRGFALLQAGRMVGYGELVLCGAGEYRLCRILIGPDWRGQGLGRCLVQSLMTLACRTLEARCLTLAVFSHNRAALACYQGLGFEPYAEEPAACELAGESWDLLRLAWTPASEQAAAQ